MGFFDKTNSKKRKRNKPVIESTTWDQTQETYSQSSEKGKFPKTTIQFTETKDELPPDTDVPILTWEHPWGFAVYRSDVCLQHILEDRKTRKERITHWTLI